MRAPGKALVFGAALLPAAVLAYRAAAGALGANPIEAITHFTGTWTLNLLLVTLAITPLRRLTGYNGLIRYRRMLGLFTFFYACLHFLTWLVLDQFFDWEEILRDIAKRPFITVGFAALLLLVPLAATSSNAMIRRLGPYWLRLHSLVYLVATLGVLHFLWLVKADLREPLLYGAVLLGLLTARLRRPSPAPARAVPEQRPPPAGAAPARVPQTPGP
jgi:sulfoxide reductase heme-binding subunit YedZ